MAVFCEFISLIIRRDSIDKYFPGGWKRFVLEVPNRSMATDGEVVRVGFMNPVDTNIYLEFLKGEGLQFMQSGDREIDDISDLDQFMGHRDERQWLEFGDRVFNESKYFCAWKKGSSIDAIARPSDAGQMMTNVSPEIFNERTELMKTKLTGTLSFLLFLTLLSPFPAFGQIFGADEENWEKVFIGLKKINSRLVNLETEGLSRMKSQLENMNKGPLLPIQKIIVESYLK